MNKWRLLLFSVFGLLQITTSDRNFIDGRSSCCDHSSRYSESDIRTSIYEPYRVKRILPDFERRKSLETRPQTRAQDLRLSSRRDINNHEHLRRINEDHQNFERQRIREYTNDFQMTQRRDFSRERNFEYSRITRDNTRQERSVRNRDKVSPKDSRSEVESRDNHRHNDERERFGKNFIRQDGFNYRRRFMNDQSRKSENSPQKLERQISETSRIARIKQHLFNDEARKIDEIRYRSERHLENDKVRNTRNARSVREYRNKEDSFIENRMRSNLRNNKNGIVLNKLQERHINRDGRTERNIRLNKRSVSDEHINYVRDTILSDENSIRNNRQRVVKRNLVMSRRSISEEAQRYRNENRERERTQKNINENRNGENSRNINRNELGRNRDENIETRRDNFERSLGKDSVRMRVTRRAATIYDFRDDVRNINRENRFSQRTSQVRRQDTRSETSNMNERHIRSSRAFRQIQEKDRRDLRESQNIRMIGRPLKEKADARSQRRVSNIHSEERDRVHNDDRRGRNFILDDNRQQRRQDRESSRLRSTSVSRRIDVDHAIDNIDEQLRQTRLQNTQERRDIRRRDRDVSRIRSISASRRHDVQNMVNDELQRIRSRSVKERSIRKQTSDKSVRSNTMANSYNFRNNLDEIRQLNRYSRDAQTRQNIRRDNRDESRIRSVRVLNVMENHEEEHRSRSRLSLERLSIRKNDRNILTSRSANLPKSYATSNNGNNVRNEVRSGDIEKSLNRYSRDHHSGESRQNMRRDNTDEPRVRSVRVLNNMVNREEEQRSRSRPSLESLSIRQNDRTILRSRSTNLPKSYASRNSRDNVRDEVSRSKRNIVRTRSTPILRTLSKNIDEEARRTATQNTLKRLTRRIGSDDSKIYSTRSPQTYISQNIRNNEASRRMRSRSLTTERRTENHQVRINRNRSLNERTTRIERDAERRNERRHTRRVPLIAATRNTLFAENKRDIPLSQTKKAFDIFEMKWQYVFYALQAIYIFSVFMKMPHNQGKKQLRITSWLIPMDYMKID
ncbi:unnamed protein product, partial [Brenthis ino]